MLFRSRRQREQIVRKFENISVRVMTLPGLADIIDGSISINNLREIEITDLLGRDPVPPNRALMRHTIEGRTVMVTGAGGSIGSELCRQIIQFAPARLILVEMTEQATSGPYRSISRWWISPKIKYLLRYDFSDSENRFNRALVTKISN